MPGHCHVKRAIPHIVVEGLGGGWITNLWWVLFQTSFCTRTSALPPAQPFRKIASQCFSFPFYLLSMWPIQICKRQCLAMPCPFFIFVKSITALFQGTTGIKWHVVAGRGILINKRGGLPLRRDSMCQWMKLLFLTILSYWPFSALVQNGRGDIFSTFIFTS